MQRKDVGEDNPILHREQTPVRSRPELAQPFLEPTVQGVLRLKQKPMRLDKHYTKSVTFFVSENMRDALKRKAKKDGISVSEYLRRIIREKHPVIDTPQPTR